MSRIYIGIDNGVSGSIGVVGDEIECFFIGTPVRKELSYQKSKKSYINRINYPELLKLFEAIQKEGTSFFVAIERPMINSSRFAASVSASRALEATLIALEVLSLPYQYCDSKQWQKMFFPPGVKGSIELKKASLDIGIRLFPDYQDVIKKQGDADGILIAEWARRSKL